MRSITVFVICDKDSPIYVCMYMKDEIRIYVYIHRIPIPYYPPKRKRIHIFCWVEKKNTNKWNERTKMLCKMSIEIYFGQDRTYMHTHYTSMYEPSTEVYAYFWKQTQFTSMPVLCCRVHK